MSGFIFVEIQCHLLKDYICPIVFPFLLCQRSVEYRDLFLYSVFCYVVYLSILFTNHSVLVNLKLDAISLPTLFFSFNIGLGIGYSGLLPLHI